MLIDMTKRVFLVKEQVKRINFLKTLAKSTIFKISQLGKDLPWLRFAKKKDHGYEFLQSVDHQLQVLKEITVDIQHSDSSYRPGEIADLFSYLLNTTPQNEIDTNGLDTISDLSGTERNYLDSQLIALVSSPTYVPRCPWLYPVELESENSWKTKDLTTGENQEINFSTDGIFQIYEVTRITL